MPKHGTEQAPDAETLHAAAVAYLARYSATRATLSRALNRIIDRWLRSAQHADAPAAAAAAKRAVPDVVGRLAAAGAVDDAAFAAQRAAKLLRTGHSRAAAGAFLAARGVPQELVTSALPADAKMELAAAVVYLRRRRLGAFRATPASAEVQRKEMGAMARAGFAGSVARQALALTRAEAEELLANRRG